MLVGAIAAPSLLALLTGMLHPAASGGQPPWRYVYAVAVYLAAIPGVFAFLLVLYALLFTGESLLEVSLLVYFGPIAGMVFALLLIRRMVDLDQVPGFNRLAGLLVLIGASLAVMFLLTRLRVLLVFGSSLVWFFVLAAALFLVLKWATVCLFGRRR